MNPQNTKDVKIINLYSEVLDYIASHDFEFVSVIDKNTGSMQVFKRKDERFIPNLLDNDADYETQLKSFLTNSISKENQKDAAATMNLPYVIKSVSSGHHLSVSYAIQNEDGDLRFKKWRYTLLPSNPNYIIFTRIDVTEAYLSERDPVTGLYTKEKAFVEIQRTLKTHPDKKFSVIYFDIDHFTAYNTLFGTKEGNRLLEYIASLIKVTYEPTCIFSRLDADHFLTLVPEEHMAYFNLENTIKRALDKFNPDFIFSPRFGIYNIKDTSEDVRIQISRAYLANRSISGVPGKYVAYYDDSLKTQIEEGQSIITSLMDGIRHKDFLVYYQPIFNIKTNRVDSAEALVRWKHPTKGIIPPGVFIPILEKNGFCMYLDAYVRE